MKPTMIILAAFLSITTMAQSQQRMKRQQQTTMSIEERAAINSKKLTLALDLNESQQAKVQELLTTHLTIQKAQREEREGKTSEELAADAAERKEARLDAKISLQNNMKEILTPEQFERYQEMQLERDSRNKGRKRRQ
ncbi:hypothetical protein GCM10009117_15460 [Gangjinia marincola]|uniref:Uncharacterized protein n=1 Tax=Gangjinia marincola TaxID=578463 RepID=A0ABP3XVJ4_9FLAO